MRSIHLPGTAITTSALGFGCAGLTSLNDRRRALELLHAAFDAGITHFDVARLYGFGHAEGILGEFIASRRDRVTVATKFGLEPPSGIVAGNAGLVSVARSVVRRFPAVAGLVRRRAARMVAASAFSPASAERSLTKSLAELRTDYVDFLLLHETTMTDACSDELLEFLASQVAAGKVRNIGVASSADKIATDLTRFPAAYSVFQFENNILDRNVQRMHGIDLRAIVTHTALKPLAVLEPLTVRRPTVTRKWSGLLGADLSDRRVLARMLLTWAVARNERGPVLFSTTRLENLRDNALAAEIDPSARERSMQFERFVGELVQGEPPELHTTSHPNDRHPS